MLFSSGSTSTVSLGGRNGTTCPVEGEISNRQIVTGFEHAQGDYIVVEEGRLESLRGARKQNRHDRRHGSRKQIMGPNFKHKPSRRGDLMRTAARLQAELDRAKTEKEREGIKKQIAEVNQRILEP
jgi:hypothetical protein